MRVNRFTTITCMTAGKRTAPLLSFGSHFLVSAIEPPFSPAVAAFCGLGARQQNSPGTIRQGSDKTGKQRLNDLLRPVRHSRHVILIEEEAPEIRASSWWLMKRLLDVASPADQTAAGAGVLPADFDQDAAGRSG